MTDSPKRPRGRPRSDLPDVARPNQFAIWMRDRGLEPAIVAKLVGVTEGTVYRWRKGTKVPSLRRALFIADISEGAVPLDTWRDAWRSTAK